MATFCCVILGKGTAAKIHVICIFPTTPFSNV